MPKFPPSRYSDHELPGVVTDVCRAADVRDPISVSQTRFDAARADAGHPEAPSAKRVCVRLRLSWEEVKKFALDPARHIDRTVGRRMGAEIEPWITPEVCIARLECKAWSLSQSRFQRRTVGHFTPLS